MDVMINHIEDISDVAACAFDMVSRYFGALSGSARIVIKPNITAPKLPGTGVTTHHQIVLGVLEALKGVRHVKVVESDATSTDFEDNIAGAGYSFIRNIPNVELVNLSKKPTKKILLRGSQSSYEVQIPELLLDYDVLINLPVMKTHILTGVSLGIKNLFGLLPDKNKSRYHCYIQDFLFALQKRFYPDITILDGIVGMEEMGPIFGKPAHAKVMLFSRDVVAVDCVAAKIMGFDPYTIPYLRLAMNHRFRMDTAHINITGSLPCRNFQKIPTLPIQIVQVLSTEGTSLDSILSRIHAPAQTIKNLPHFIDSLVSKEIIMNADGKYFLNRDKLEILFTLFPETEDEVARSLIGQ
jgi:uncharacterized protein (DUF362 family)